MFLNGCVTMYPRNGLEMYNQVLKSNYCTELESIKGDAISNSDTNNPDADCDLNKLSKSMDIAFEAMHPHYILIPFYRQIQQIQKTQSPPIIAMPQQIVGLNSAIRYRHPTTPLFIGSNLVYHSNNPANNAATTLPIVVTNSRNGKSFAQSIIFQLFFSFFCVVIDFVTFAVNIHFIYCLCAKYVNKRCFF